MSTNVYYHEPGKFGDCDRCDNVGSRPAYELPNGEDICGWCYGIYKGYIPESDNSGNSD